MFEVIKYPGFEILLQLEKLREAYPVTKKYPFIIGDEKEMELLMENAEFDNQKPEIILLNSSKIDIPSWFQGEKLEAGEYEFDEEELLGEWLDEPQAEDTILAHTDISTGEIKPVVYLGMALIDEPWMLASAVKYGNWNSCPAPDIQCAIMKYWEEKYGAEIVSMTGDTIECKVKNPPATKDAAIQLAWEQYWYCADIVDQGTQTIANLAAGLINSEYWFFWWD